MTKAVDSRREVILETSVSGTRFGATAAFHTPTPDPAVEEEDPDVKHPPVPPDQEDEIVPVQEPPQPGGPAPMIGLAEKPDAVRRSGEPMDPNSSASRRLWAHRLPQSDVEPHMAAFTGETYG